MAQGQVEPLWVEQTDRIWRAVFRHHPHGDAFSPLLINRQAQNQLHAVHTGLFTP